MPRGYHHRASKKLRNIWNNSKQVREEWQAKKAEKEETKDLESKKAHAIRAIKHDEAANRMWAIMRKYLNPENQSLLTHIMVSDKERHKENLNKSVEFYTKHNQPEKAVACAVMYHAMRDYKTGLEKHMSHKIVVLKEDMEESLMLYHQEHFKQACSTPFATGPLAELIGYCADTPFAEQLRDGTADTELIKTDRYNKEFLKELHHKTTDPPKIPTDMTLTDVKQGFKLWNKKASISWLGNYLGLYKTWFKKEKEHVEYTAEELQIN
eukprot:15364692-Ditylum_brightwellii.AAC.2